MSSVVVEFGREIHSGCGGSRALGKIGIATLVGKFEIESISNGFEAMSDWQMFTTSFSGPSNHECAYRLLVAEDGLQVSFLAKKPPLIIDLAQPNQFCEGLWRGDCGELWLASLESSRYIEVNLAPNGAWWTCVFSSPRIRDLDCPPPQSQNLQSESLGQYWQASLVLPWTEVFRCLQSKEAPLANVTLVLGGCDHPDEKLENLHSIVSLGAHDFHRPQDWVPLSNLI